MSTEVNLIIEFCKTNLDLRNPPKPSEYSYDNLPLCVIDAVFSIGVNYAATRNTVERFRNYLQNPESGVDYHITGESFSISEFVKIQKRLGYEWMARVVYKNKQRTSSRNGILKAEAVTRFSEVLQNYKIEFFKDVRKTENLEPFKLHILAIPGQGSGLSLRYFYMLAGYENLIKPDRMIRRFLQAILGREPNEDECQELLEEASELLGQHFPGITPRTLDNMIWSYQRKK